jgi:3-dehydroquinate synthase
MRQVPVNTRDGSYRVLIGRGLLTQAGRLLRELLPGPTAIVVSDTTVARTHGGRLIEALKAAGYGVRLLEVPPGEPSKSLAQADWLYAALADAQADRATPLLALGGGVVSDLAGFVSATWMRGMPFAILPTTTEADLDASLGGKTAVNHSAGKNLIGAFHQPRLVIIDVDCLATLPDRDYAAGLAESVKHAMIADRGFFEWQIANHRHIGQRDPQTLEALIERNCSIKAEVVAGDEREAGPRMVLNLGHTVGHAFEAEMEYELRHGECVALGILAASLIAAHRGTFPSTGHERLVVLLQAYGLPTRLPRPVTVEAVLARLAHDKKVRGGRRNFVLPTAIGEVQIVGDVQDAEIAHAAESLQPIGG